MGVMEKAAGKKLDAPWWLTWLLVFGLGLTFASAKILDHLETAAPLLAALGALIVLGVTGWRAAAFVQATGDRKRVELWHLLGSVGCVVALLLYGLSGAGEAFSWLK